MIFKNKDIKANINERGIDLGDIGARYYTEDEQTASIRIFVKWNDKPVDLGKVNMRPVLNFYMEDGSIFEDVPVKVIMADKGIVQCNIPANVIKHIGKVRAKLFLVNENESIHAVNFSFNIVDSGVEGPVRKELSFNLVDDAIRRIIKESTLSLLDDTFKADVNEALKAYVMENPNEFKGPKGDQGEQGIQGVKGDVGPIGPQGYKGEKGDTGKDGIDGNSTQVHVNPLIYGASKDADWQTNKSAIQQAIDECESKGGGTVSLSPGTYFVKGLDLKNNVTLSGEGVTLKNPDGIAPDIVKTYATHTQAVINDNKLTLTLSDVTNVKKGAVIAVRAGRGMHYSQNTTLVDSVDNNQTTGIKLQNAYGFVAAGHMIIGNEVISYTGINNGELTGVQRGLFGTTAENHSQGDVIGIAARFYTTIAELRDNVATLESAIPFNIKNADVTIGVVNPKIKDIRFDGNRILGGAPSEVHPIKFELTRFGLIENVTAQNGESGIMARNGNHDLLINNPTFIDCGVIEKTFGSGGWLFRGNRRCKYQNVTAVGKMWTGIYFDDRTSTGLEWDEENYDCVLNGLYAKIDRLSDNLGFAMVGSVRNVAKNCKISGPRTGFSCTSNSQGVGYVDYNGRDNILQDIQVDNVYQPTLLKAQRTKLYNVTYDGTSTSYKKFVDSRDDTQYINSGAMDNIKTTYDDGTYNAPSYAFTKDPTTGYYRIKDGSIQFVSQGVATVRFISYGLQMMEGKNLVVGSTSGTKIGTSPKQKLGFFGSTPIVQPDKIGTIASTSTLEDTVNQMNKIIIALRNLGIVSDV